MFLLKNKISFIFLIFIAFIAIFSAKCFASFDFTTDDDVSHSISDLPFNIEEYPYFFIMVQPVNDYYLYYITFSSNPFIANASGTSIWNTSSHHRVSFNYSNSGGYGSVIDESAAREGNGSYSVNNSYSYFYSHDVLDSDGNVVFQKASQPTVDTQGTLAKIVEEQETEKVMEEIVGILPIVIVVIVSLIAIRKAIQWIRQTLKQQ